MAPRPWRARSGDQSRSSASLPPPITSAISGPNASASASCVSRISSSRRPGIPRLRWAPPSASPTWSAKPMSRKPSSGSRTPAATLSPTTTMRFQGACSSDVGRGERASMSLEDKRTNDRSSSFAGDADPRPGSCICILLCRYRWVPPRSQHGSRRRSRPAAGRRVSRCPAFARSRVRSGARRARRLAPTPPCATRACCRAVRGRGSSWPRAAAAGGRGGAGTPDALRLAGQRRPGARSACPRGRATPLRSCRARAAASTGSCSSRAARRTRRRCISWTRRAAAGTTRSRAARSAASRCTSSISGGASRGSSWRAGTRTASAGVADLDGRRIAWRAARNRLSPAARAADAGGGVRAASGARGAGGVAPGRRGRGGDGRGGRRPRGPRRGRVRRPRLGAGDERAVRAGARSGRRRRPPSRCSTRSRRRASRPGSRRCRATTCR